MTYVLGFTIAHVEMFLIYGHHLREVVRLRNGASEVVRALFLRHMAS